MFRKKKWNLKFKKLYKTFEIRYVAASLAYNLPESNTTTMSREKLFSYLKDIRKGSTVMLFFGEIDCRVHILEQAKRQNKSVDEVVKKCVDRYFSVILEIINLDFNVIVFNAVASSPNSKWTRNIPLYGSNKKRNKATKIFNRYLSELCEVNSKCVFISIFDELVDENLKTKNEYYRDRVHLGLKAYPLVIRKMNELVDGFYYHMED